MSQNKYHNVKITTEYGEFDSKKEARRYEELLDMEKAGDIYGLLRQVNFLLVEKHELKEPRPHKYKSGKRKGQTYYQKVEGEVTYKADFTYWLTDGGVFVVEDVKGMITPEYAIKRKLMLDRFGVQIKEV